MELLPTEIVHHIAFTLPTLTPRDTLALALTSHHLFHTLFGSISNPNPYDVAQHRAKGGVVLCAHNNWARAARLALRRGYGDPSGEDNYVFTWACQQGYADLITILLADPRVDPVGNDHRAFQTACACGHKDVLRTLLADPLGRFDPSYADNITANLPLLWTLESTTASRSTVAEIVRDLFLPDPRVDPAADRSIVLIFAAKYGYVGLVEHLLEAYPDVDPAARRNKPIMLAAEYGHVEMVKLLMADPRVDCSARNNYALMWAGIRKHVDVVRLLLEDGRVDPGVKNNILVKDAARKGDLEMVKMLVGTGRVDLRGRKGESVVASAEKGGWDEVVDYIRGVVGGGDS